MDAVLGLAFTRTGPMLYPIFGTLLGWLGVALTGSDTSSNVLFGNLQKITAQKLGLNPILMASANTTGGVMGKMIDAQSIVVAAAATGEGGQEGEILRAVLWHSIALALMVGGDRLVLCSCSPGARGPGRKRGLTATLRRGGCIEGASSPPYAIGTLCGVGWLRASPGAEVVTWSARAAAATSRSRSSLRSTSSRRRLGDGGPRIDHQEAILDHIGQAEWLEDQPQRRLQRQVLPVELDRRIY